MHNLGQSNLETHMQEFAPEYGASQEGPYETAVAGESPLHEILAHEAPVHEGAYETPMHEAGYQETWEAPYQEVYEAPYQEVYEAPYQEAPYQEAPGYEAASFEDEAPLGEVYSAESGMAGEYLEGSWNEVISEDEELALASELLEVQGEDELDRFLGKLVRRISRGVRGLVRSPIGRMLGGVLRRVARVALPVAGKVLGTFVGGPAGAMIGGKLASFAGSAMGLELHEMSPPEADFAAARQFVRLAAEMMRRAQTAPPGASPSAVVRQAVQGAAQQLAPGLLSRRLPPLRVGPRRAGRRGVWARRGGTIILFGV